MVDVGVVLLDTALCRTYSLKMGQVNYRWLQTRDEIIRGMFVKGKAAHSHAHTIYQHWSTR